MILLPIKITDIFTAHSVGYQGPDPGLWELRWGYIPTDLFYVGPMGSEEDQ